MTGPGKVNDSDMDGTFDPVVEEVRERGRRVTQRFDYDPKKLFKALQRLSEEYPEKMVGQLRIVPLSEPAPGN